MDNPFFVISILGAIVGGCAVLWCKLDDVEKAIKQENKKESKNE